MKNGNLKYLEEKAEKRRKRREKKRRPRMKIVGAGVKTLQKLINKNK